LYFNKKIIYINKGIEVIIKSFKFIIKKINIKNKVIKMDQTKEAFRKYLENNGIIDALTKGIIH